MKTHITLNTKADRLQAIRDAFHTLDPDAADARADAICLLARTDSELREATALRDAQREAARDRENQLELAREYDERAR